MCDKYRGPSLKVSLARSHHHQYHRWLLRTPVFTHSEREPAVDMLNDGYRVFPLIFHIHMQTSWRIIPCFQSIIAIYELAAPEVPALGTRQVILIFNRANHVLGSLIGKILKIPIIQRTICINHSLFMWSTRLVSISDVQDRIGVLGLAKDD